MNVNSWEFNPIKSSREKGEFYFREYRNGRNLSNFFIYAKQKNGWDPIDIHARLNN